MILACLIRSLLPYTACTTITITVNRKSDLSDRRPINRRERQDGGLSPPLLTMSVENIIRGEQ
jgi:hypothetical protein